MESESARNEKWTLTRESLEVFLNYLDADRERAGEKYETIRQKLLTLFRCNGCWTAEDLVDETIDRVIRRLGEVEVRELMPFIRGVGRKVVSETYQKAQKAREIPLADDDKLSQPLDADPESERELDQRLQCLEKCVPLLNQNDRELIMQWYIYDKGQKIENRRRLAELRSASQGALRVQAFRARKRLQELVKECLAESRTA
jgi:DNA-directed RNA polymerase specialized sigma24 family protein